MRAGGTARRHAAAALRPGRHDHDPATVIMRPWRCGVSIGRNDGGAGTGGFWATIDPQRRALLPSAAWPIASRSWLMRQERAARGADWISVTADYYHSTDPWQPQYGSGQLAAVVAAAEQ